MKRTNPLTYKPSEREGWRGEFRTPQEVEGPGPLPKTGEGNTRIRKLHDSPVTRELGKVLLERRLMGGQGEKESWTQYQRDVFSISQLQNQMGFLFPARSSKHHKSSACSPTHILQNAASTQPPSTLKPVILEMQLVRIPVDALSPTLGPELPIGAAVAGCP